VERLQQSVHLGLVVLLVSGEPLRDVREHRVPPLA